MKPLSREELVSHMNNKDIKSRLIITPLIDPESSIDECSVDVRLGNEFIVMRKQSFAILDIADKTHIETHIGKYQDRVRINFHEEFILHPRQLIIGSTFEYVHIPPGLMCYVIGKSTWGRMGLIVATATKVDPGFKGCITLEIINEGEVPIKLYPGIPIAQIVFHNVGGTGRYKGSYQCPTGPQFPSIIGNNKKNWTFWYPKG